MQLVQMKEMSCRQLYNMFNDNRHMAILDMRRLEDFNLSQVRSSVNIYQDPIKLDQYLTLQNENALKNEEKYKLQPIRRLILLDQDPNKIIEKQQLISDMLHSLYLNKFKVFYLKENVGVFLEKYPFYQMSAEILQKYEAQTQQINEDQEKVLFAYCQFPSELIENEIFLGSVLNANSKRQLNSLHIKTIIDFKFYDDNKQPKEWKQEYNYQNIPIPLDTIPNINFDEITELINQQQKPILLACADGYSVVNCIAIGYLMKTNNLQYNIASLQVFQVRGNTTVHKQLYAQLLQYKPMLKN